MSSRNLTQRRTKVVATLGPATASPEMIRKLIDAGMNMARINGSHGDHETHARTIATIREQAHESRRAVGILFDLQGPKIRVGKFAGDAKPVKVGDIVSFAVGRAPTGDELPSDYDGLDRDVQPGQPLLIDDGNIVLQITHVEKGLVRARVLNDGAIAQRKGMNLPQSIVSAPAITEKDRADVLFAVQQKVDCIAMSFVRRPQDVLELKELLASVGAQTPIISKIEKPQALQNLRGILEVSWGVMVARGDLGVELSPEEVPMAQKRIIREALRIGRPVITATQMLDSMTRNPRPTRAEASDVANAVLDGTDAVMLSGETASGKYPIESITMMDKIIEVTEKTLQPNPLARRRERGLDTSDKVVIDSGCNVAAQLHAHAIVAFTLRGTTAVLCSQRRPLTSIIAFTPSPQVRDLMSVVWGVQPHIISQHAETTEKIFEELDSALLGAQLAEKGDRLVVMMSSPRMRHGPTNVMTVHQVGYT